MPTFERISEFRIKKGISQKELAEKSMVTQAMIARIETGVKDPSVALLVRIARALDCKPEDLYTIN